MNLPTFPHPEHQNNVDTQDTRSATSNIRERGRRLHETLELGAAEVLRAPPELLEVDVRGELAVSPEALGVDLEDLHASFLVG